MLLSAKNEFHVRVKRTSLLCVLFIFNNIHEEKWLRVWQPNLPSAKHPFVATERFACLPTPNIIQPQHNATTYFHRKKGFVIPTKSFVKIGIAKIFCYNNKMFSSINKTFRCCSKIFGCSDKNFICCPLFCWRNNTVFSMLLLESKMLSQDRLISSWVVMLTKPFCSVCKLLGVINVGSSRENRILTRRWTRNGLEQKFRRSALETQLFSPTQIAIKLNGKVAEGGRDVSGIGTQKLRSYLKVRELDWSEGRGGES